MFKKPIKDDPPQQEDDKKEEVPASVPWQKLDKQGQPTEPPPGHGDRPQVGEK